MFARIALGFSLAALALACNRPDSVKAADYDQSCAADADCVLVGELEVTGGDCFGDCKNSAAINKRAEASYHDALQAESAKCDGMPGLDCGPSKVSAKCIARRCVAAKE